ncbi:hypothetical protein OG21DRAFT_387921 [Imleria badia]|nr:hypothetical protein OG21DRAFT_387921 [Imleria badia]
MWPFVALAPVTGLVTTLTQGFYCWRISSLRRSHLLPFPIMMVSLLQLASIIYLAFTDDLAPALESSSLSFKLPPFLVTWLGSTVVCDSVITICMILCLRPS